MKTNNIQILNELLLPPNLPNNGALSYNSTSGLLEYKHLGNVIQLQKQLYPTAGVNNSIIKYNSTSGLFESSGCTITSSNDLTANSFAFLGTNNLLYTSDSESFTFRFGTTPSYIAFTNVGGVPRINAAAGNIRLATAGVDRMHISSSGAIGIGTTTPGANLHVKASSQYTSFLYQSDYNGVEGPYFIFRKTRNDGAITAGDSLGTLIFRGTNTSGTIADGANIIAKSINVGAGFVEANLGISTTNSAGVMSEKLTITGEGNIGIGITAPDQALDIRRATASSLTTLKVSNTATDNNASKGTRLLFNISDTTGALKSTGSIVNYVDNSNAVDAGLIFNVRKADVVTEALRITKDGYVGIGTVPQAMFHLRSSAQFQPQILIQSDYDGSSAGYLNIVKTRNNGPVLAGDTIGTILFKAPDSGNVQRNAGSLVGYVISVGAGYVETRIGITAMNNLGQAVERISIYGSGLVGIGKTPVTTKLAIGGGVQIADETATASSSNEGSIRYRTDTNNSYIDMVMKTGASTYAWVNIKTNTW